MKRSVAGLIIAVVLTSLMASLATAASPAAKLSRIGLLTFGAAPTLRDVFRQSLRDLGYIEGQNLAVEERDAGGKDELLPERAAELVAREAEVIVAVGYPAVRAAQQATRTIPIVMLVGGDPIGSGLLPSLTRPGGNLTGLAALSSKLSVKRLALLKEVVPTASRVAVLFNPSDESKALDWTQTQAASRMLGVLLQPLEVQDPDAIERAFATMRQERTDALITFGDVFTLRHRSQIVTLAAQSQLPAIYELRAFVEAGGLMAYGPRLVEMFRQVTVYVDKILKGAKPADLPVEQPTTFELVINLKTAQALGLTIPPAILFQADEVIQ
jgi:putative tryptophan/tyrosine transport system substrate-binding protein